MKPPPSVALARCPVPLPPMRRCASVAGLIDELPCVRCAQARDAACFQCARGTNAHDGQHGHAPLLVRAAYCVRERCVALTAVDRLFKCPGWRIFGLLGASLRTSTASRRSSWTWMRSPCSMVTKPPSLIFPNPPVSSSRKHTLTPFDPKPRWGPQKAPVALTVLMPTVRYV